MPGDSGVLVVTRVRSTNTKCTRGRGCHGHPAFPTPSLGGRSSNASGAWRREGEVVSGFIVIASRRLDCHAFENCKVDVRAERSLTSHHKTHPSCPELIRASINLVKSSCEEDGSPGQAR